VKFGLRYSPTAREMPLASGTDFGYCDAWVCSLCHWHEPEQVSLQIRCLYGALNSRIPLSVIDMPRLNDSVALFMKIKTEKPSAKGWLSAREDLERKD
jgi:hypothetical protein